MKLAQVLEDLKQLDPNGWQDFWPRSEIAKIARAPWILNVSNCSTVVFSDVLSIGLVERGDKIRLYRTIGKQTGNEFDPTSQSEARRLYDVLKALG